LVFFSKLGEGTKKGGRKKTNQRVGEKKKTASKNKDPTWGGGERKNSPVKFC